MEFAKFYYENDDINSYDEKLQPRVFMSEAGVDSVLEEIVASQPYTLKITDVKQPDLALKLLNMEVLKEKEGRLALAIPTFIEKDVPILKRLSQNVALEISRILVHHQQALFDIVNSLNNGFSLQRNLYHLLCGKIFDGLIFDDLESHSLLTTSKNHATGLDYLMILYEKSPILDSYSCELLCSYNRWTKEGCGFVSFGDCDGDRKDFYRYECLKRLGLLSKQELIYLQDSKETYIQQFKHLSQGQKVDEKYLKSFEYFGYVQNGKIAVPVYDEKSKKVIDELHKVVLELIEVPLFNALKKIAQEKFLLSIQHEVDVKDIANEIYHLIFGEVNEILVKEGLVDRPPYIQGEGRYLKCFER